MTLIQFSTDRFLNWDPFGGGRSVDRIHVIYEVEGENLSLFSLTFD